MRGGSPFTPTIPRNEPSTMRFATELVNTLNVQRRNEFTVSVPCEDALCNHDMQFGLIGRQLTVDASLHHTASIKRPWWSPDFTGLVLRRVRIVSSEQITGSLDSGPTLLVRAIVGTTNGEDVVGTYDSNINGLVAYSPRLLSVRDLGKTLPPDCVFAVETTQRGWPKKSARVLTVLFDVGVT